METQTILQEFPTSMDELITQHEEVIQEEVLAAVSDLNFAYTVQNKSLTLFLDDHISSRFIKARLASDIFGNPNCDGVILIRNCNEPKLRIDVASEKISIPKLVGGGSPSVNNVTMRGKIIAKGFTIEQRFDDSFCFTFVPVTANGKLLHVFGKQYGAPGRLTYPVVDYVSLTDSDDELQLGSLEEIPFERAGSDVLSDVDQVYIQSAKLDKTLRHITKNTPLHEIRLSACLHALWDGMFDTSDINYMVKIATVMQKMCHPATSPHVDQQ